MTALRLLLTPSTALRFLRLVVPSLLSYFALSLVESEPRKAWSCYSRNPHRTLKMDVNSFSQVPGKPFVCICPALGPRPNEACQVSIAFSCCPRGYEYGGFDNLACFEAQSHSFCTRCLRFTIGIASLPCKTHFRLQTTLCRVGFFIPTRFQLEVSVATSSSTRFFLAQHG